MDKQQQRTEDNTTFSYGLSEVTEQITEFSSAVFSITLRLWDPFTLFLVGFDVVFAGKTRSVPGMSVLWELEHASLLHFGGAVLCREESFPVKQEKHSLLSATISALPIGDSERKENTTAP